MRNSTRQQKYFAFFNDYVFKLVAFQNFQTHVSFSHEKKFFPLFQMVIFSLIWSSNVKYLKFRQISPLRTVVHNFTWNQIQRKNLLLVGYCASSYYIQGAKSTFGYFQSIFPHCNKQDLKLPFSRNFTQLSSFKLFFVYCDIGSSKKLLNLFGIPTGNLIFHK